MSGIDELPGAASGLVIRRSDTAGEIVLECIGELDLASTVELESALSGLPGDGRRTVLDLRRLSFMDSRGLSLVVRTHGDAQRGGGELVLRSPSPQVRRLLELTGMLERLTVEG